MGVTWYSGVLEASSRLHPMGITHKCLDKYFCCCFETFTYVAQNALKLMISPLQPSNFWGYRHVPICLELQNFELSPQVTSLKISYGVYIFLVVFKQISGSE